MSDKNKQHTCTKCGQKSVTCPKCGGEISVDMEPVWVPYPYVPYPWYPRPWWPYPMDTTTTWTCPNVTITPINTSGANLTSKGTYTTS